MTERPKISFRKSCFRQLACCQKLDQTELDFFVWVVEFPCSHCPSKYRLAFRKQSIASTGRISLTLIEKMRMFLSTAFLALCLISQASSHSWHVCNDYTIVPTSASTNTQFDASACKGWARSYGTTAATIVPNNLFSGDSGYPVQPGTNGNPCKVTRTAGTALSTYYSASFPMANYTIGGSYMVLWPAKNHGTGTNIPDTSMQLYAVCDTTTDPTVNTYMTAANMVIDWKVTPGTGFKHCPAADAGVSSDGAQCYQYFNVTNAFFGNYVGKTCTFIWHWEFNNVGDLYTSCFDANIMAAADAATTTGGGTTTNGGTTSGGSAAASTNSSGKNAGIAVGVTLALFGCAAGVVYINKKKPEVFERLKSTVTAPRTTQGEAGVASTNL
eukprot:TRINITY_DN11326_c0_g1_i3.p1 TRINITY_DN11326_c0_g1~~TRINITY_DN11326_c0_g1_i3.p1  ORF type:complete len:385 (-),score=78.71 TRINITY_DN11326_c0_g1_i3:1392-2546(-)